MLKRLTVLLLMTVPLLSTSARAQAQTAPSADEQAMRDQLRQSFETIMQNMQAKGIDPGQFFQQIQNGADPADIQKQLVDRGIIDQDTLTKMQSNMLKLTTSRIRDQLDVTDSEWEALAPLVQNVMADMAAVNRTGGGGGGMAAFMTQQSPAAANLAKASRDLRAALQDPTAPAQQVASLLRTYRDARAKVQDELDSARIQLSSVLTIRQEAVLSALGLLE